MNCAVTNPPRAAACSSRAACCPAGPRHFRAQVHHGQVVLRGRHLLARQRLQCDTGCSMAAGLVVGHGPVQGGLLRGGQGRCGVGPGADQQTRQGDPEWGAEA